jgi:hypothetical protein
MLEVDGITRPVVQWPGLVISNENNRAGVSHPWSIELPKRRGLWCFSECRTMDKSKNLVSEPFRMSLLEASE